MKIIFICTVSLVVISDLGTVSAKELEGRVVKFVESVPTEENVALFHHQVLVDQILHLICKITKLH